MSRPRPLTVSLLILPILAIAFPPTPAAAQDAAATFDLRPRFKEGRTTKYDVWTRRQQTNVVSVAGQSQTAQMQMEVTGQVTWRVDRVNADGSAVCTMATDWMAVSMTAEGQTVKADSRGGGDNERLQTLVEALANNPVTYEISADGLVQSVSGIDAIQQAAGDIEAPDEDDFTESAYDLATLPGALAELSPGGGWTQTIKLTHEMGAFEAPVQYRLETVERIAGIPVANISAQAPLTFTPELPELPEGATADARLIEGSLTSQVMFDLSRHEAVGRNTIQKQTLRVQLQLGARTISREVTEVIHGQVLRAAEQ
jgi:hypothetical protein